MVKEHFSSKILTALLISITPALPPPPPLITLQLTFMINFIDQLINQFIPVHYLPTQSVTLCSKEGCMWVLALFVCLFFFSELKLVNHNSLSLTQKVLCEI